VRETQRILDALKRQLRARGITYAELGRRIGLSESSVKRLFGSGNFTLSRLEQICGVVQLTLAELARSVDKGGKAVASATFSEEQEQLLASDPSLLACFYLMLNGRSTQDCRTRLKLESTALQEIMRKLASVGLVSGTAERVVLGTSLPINWRQDGPVRRLYERQVRDEFLRCAFTAPGEALAFHSAELSAASLRVMKRKLDRLAADFAELAALDVDLKPREKTSVGMLLAVRPWVFSMFGGLRKQAADTDSRD
jgi:transcriptional regulator with XRE-family HTH domain